MPRARLPDLRRTLAACPGRGSGRGSSQGAPGCRSLDGGSPGTARRRQCAGTRLPRSSGRRATPSGRRWKPAAVRSSGRPRSRSRRRPLRAEVQQRRRALAALWKAWVCAVREEPGVLRARAPLGCSSEGGSTCSEMLISRGGSKALLGAKGGSGKCGPAGCRRAGPCGGGAAEVAANRADAVQGCAGGAQGPACLWPRGGSPPEGSAGGDPRRRASARSNSLQDATVLHMSAATGGAGRPWSRRRGCRLCASHGDEEAQQQEGSHTLEPNIGPGARGARSPGA